MSKFVRLLLGLIGVLLGINFILYALIGVDGESRFYEYYEVTERLNKTHYRYLVTGDSHANAVWRRDSNPDILDMTFPGDNQVDVRKKIHFLRINGITYDTHLYQADEHILTDYREKTNNNDLSSNFDTKMVWIKIRKLLPLVTDPRIGESLLNKFSGAEKDSSDMPHSIDESKMKQRCKVQYDTKLSNKMVNFFSENVKLEKESDASIVFVQYPLYDTYFELVNQAFVFKVSRDSIFSIQEVAQVENLDFSRAFCKPRFFSDQDHLNAEGANLMRFFCLKSLAKGDLNIDGCID
jgi:hypothetical protein